MFSFLSKKKTDPAKELKGALGDFTLPSFSKADIELLRGRGLKYLATTTPIFEGRSFGTNLLEAALTAYAGKGRVLTVEELESLQKELKIEPTLQKLN